MISVDIRSHAVTALRDLQAVRHVRAKNFRQYPSPLKTDPKRQTFTQQSFGGASKSRTSATSFLPPVLLFTSPLREPALQQSTSDQRHTMVPRTPSPKKRVKEEALDDELLALATPSKKAKPAKAAKIPTSASELSEGDRLIIELKEVSLVSLKQLSTLTSR